jgi:hypothetical protein
MCRLYLGTTVALLTLHLCGYAADLSKIPRTIGKEPAYQAQPKYCLVVFGPEAKTRVWLVLDGDTLYADRNGDGDVMGKEERIPKEYLLRGAVFQVGKITGRYRDTSFTLEVVVNPGGDDQDSRATIWCRPAQGKGFEQRTDGVLLFADRPKEAPIVHFGGPHTLTILDWHRPLQSPRFVRGGQENQLSVLVGTPVFGGKHRAFATIYELFRGDSVPIVEVEFPGKESGPKSIVTRADVRK